MNTDEDLALAIQLQSEFNEESPAVVIKTTPDDHSKLSPVDPSWEYLDPIPDIRALFLQFNDQFFWGRLAGIEVRWSPRMTLCAGLCCYAVYLYIYLTGVLLQHEMIHAYLFVTDNNKDHDGHGPEFHKHMYRINKETGANISVYHTFHDEVENYRQHWWRCTGPCRQRKPFFGFVKRAMNRAPSERDPWWRDHKNSCNGVFEKVKEPEGYGKKKKASEKSESSDVKKQGKGKETNKNMDIRLFGGKGNIMTSDKGKGSSVNDTNSTNENRNKRIGGIGGNTDKKVSVGGVLEKKVSVSGNIGKKVTANGNTGKKVATSGNKPTSTVTQEPTSNTLVNGVLSSKVSVNSVTSGSRSSTQPHHQDNQVSNASHVTVLDSDEDDWSEICKPVTINQTPIDSNSSALTSGQGDVRLKLREVWANKFDSASSSTGLPALSRPKKLTQGYQSTNGSSVTKRCKSEQDSEQCIDRILGTTSGNSDFLSVDSKEFRSGSQNDITSKTKSATLDGKSISIFGSKKTNISGKNNPGKKTSHSGSQKTVIGSNQNTVSDMFSKMRSPSKDSGDRVVSLDPSSPTFHECPVCTKSVLATEMNTHLDLCLSS
ncbi:LOW QUALITY PROTEIN: DNA-dependent metalloprotease SPRTN-like [Argopecten irradians]|uniref:LOW QUALITY PROTEIN: DNA-dependent metalloprotease SPRTN-like n=1 Tax=Argopecten irradians TaxID=31199 RepID=UPI003710B7C4